MSGFSTEQVISYTLAFAMGAGAAAGDSLLRTAFQLPPQILLPYGAVILIVWYRGFRPGIVCTVTGIGASIYMAGLSYPELTAAVIVFFLTSISVCLAFEDVRTGKQVDMYREKTREAQRQLAEKEKECIEVRREILARDEFLSIASHELKTPLTSMLLQLQSVLYNIRNVSLANFSVAKLLKMLESAEQQSKRLAKMINDLLNLSLITTGRLELSPEKFDLSQVTKQVVEQFSEKFKREHYLVTVKAEEEVQGVWDKIRIEQVISNLVANAVKYGDGQPIHVSVGSSNSHAYLRVKDHGIGIQKDKMTKIFARFTRGVTERKFDGLGVGLYITKLIVEAHKGTIHVTSKQGKGSTFTVYLPLKPSS